MWLKMILSVSWVDFKRVLSLFKTWLKMTFSVAWVDFKRGLNLFHWFTEASLVLLLFCYEIITNFKFLLFSLFTEMNTIKKNSFHWLLATLLLSYCFLQVSCKEKETKSETKSDTKEGKEAKDSVGTVIGIDLGMNWFDFDFIENHMLWEVNDFWLDWILIQLKSI